MFLRLLLLFTLVPLLELFLLLETGKLVGPFPTLALVLATGALGAWLARGQGLRVAAELRAELAAGKMPARALVEGMLVLVAGAVLLTPGLLTDLAGFLLLVPAGRARVGAWVIRRFRHALERRQAGGRVVILDP